MPNEVLSEMEVEVSYKYKIASDELREREDYNHLADKLIVFLMARLDFYSRETKAIMDELERGVSMNCNL